MNTNGTQYRKIGIMQPYFMPYIGYFQLMHAVDVFIVYDNIEYSKQSWINRNRILMHGKDVYLILPLEKDSDFLNINQRYLSKSSESVQKKNVRRIESAYNKAPYFDQVMPLIEECFLYDNKNLFDFIFHSIRKLHQYLQLDCQLVVSSQVNSGKDQKGEDRIITICKSMDASHYINPIGGKELYDKSTFLNHGIKLSFLKNGEILYPQFQNEFVPNLSIIDVLMFNPLEKVREFLETYTLE